ncbi:MAG: hypothetical protein CBE00_00275 [Planctomycetaceae bacterium TMED240]|nr:hypothetical protein [Rhodopirellula sp.]OUX09025.1 MAG: hypothetical protein CBE00_00275 [Planctomycetaceae bacterium TMED240]
MRSGMRVLSIEAEFAENSDFSDFWAMSDHGPADTPFEPAAGTVLFLVAGSLNRGGNLFR